MSSERIGIELRDLLARHPDDSRIERPPFQELWVRVERRKRRRSSLRAGLGVMAAAVAIATVIVAARPERPAIEAASPLVTAASRLSYLGPGAGHGIGEVNLVSLYVPGDDGTTRQAVALADRHQPDERLAVVEITDQPNAGELVAQGEPVELGGLTAGREHLASGASRLTWPLGERHAGVVTARGLDDGELARLIRVVTLGSGDQGSVEPVLDLEVVDSSGRLTTATGPIDLVEEPELIELSVHWLQVDESAPEDPSIMLKLQASSFAAFAASRMADNFAEEMAGDRQVWSQRVDANRFVTWWDPAGVAMSAISWGADEASLDQLVAGVDVIGPDGWQQLAGRASSIELLVPGASGLPDTAETAGTLPSPPSTGLDAGPLARFEVGTVTVQGGPHGVAISRPDEATVVAMRLQVRSLAGYCGVTPLDPGQVRDPGEPAFTDCNGDSYDLDGDCLAGGCHVGLTRLRVEVAGGRVVLHESEILPATPRSD